MLRTIARLSIMLLLGTAVVVATLLLGTFVPFFEYQLRVVESGSMAPAIPVGAVTVVQPAERYQVGDVVMYQRRGTSEVVTHRIVDERSEGGVWHYNTQGDANNTPDAFAVTGEEIVGSVAWHVPYLGYVLNFFRSPLGFLILVGLPVLLVITEQPNAPYRQERQRNAVSVREQKDV